MKNSDWAGIALCVLAVFATGAAFAEPISISTIEDLQKIGSDAAYPLNGDYVLTQNIDATATATWNDGKGFKPIGGLLGFTGSLDGQGFAITNLTINRPTEYFIGLFGVLRSGGSITNLGIEDGSVVGGVTSGILVSLVAEGAEVSGCHATAPVTGSGYVGGMVGSNAGTVSGCSTTGTVTGTGSWCYTGGMVGNNDSGVMVECFARGPVSGATSGILESHVGGLVGANDAGFVYASYATGQLIAASAKIYTGGLAGGNSGTISKCYWDAEITGQATSYGSAPSFGVTTEELQQQSTYTDWDFEQVWAIDGTVNDGYPYLIQPYIGSDVQVPVEGETPTEGEAPAIEGESTPAEGQEGELQTTDAPAQASGTGCFAG